MSETTELHAHDENRIDIAHHDRGEEYQPEPQAAEDGERPRSRRDIDMEEIGRKRMLALREELRIGEDMADDARRASGLEPLPHETEANPEELQEDPHGGRSRASQREEHTDQSQQPAARPPQLRQITIDGNQFSVTEQQYEALAGLGARTNIALQQHNQAAQHAPQAAPHPQQQQSPDAITDAEAAGVAERLLFGGKEDVAKTLKDLSNHLLARTRAESQQMNAATIQAQRAEIEHRDVSAALTQISTEYPDLWENRVLAELAAVQLGHVRQENQATGRTMSNLDTYREACNRVREALGTSNRRDALNSANAQATTRQSSSRERSDRSDVVDRKRAAPSQPSAMGRRNSEVAAPRALTSSEIVAKMRVARHQIPE
jgi:hypothetical protein